MNNGITTLQNLSGSAAISGPNANTGVKTDAARNDNSAAAKADQASLSAVGDLIAKALSSVDPNSDVRLDKILPLQQAIANGSYSVSASDVAGKIVDSLLS